MTANVGTFDNVLPVGVANLTVQGVTGKPTAYNVYYDGALVVSGSWPTPTPPGFLGGADNSVTVTGTGSLSLTPKTGAATPVVNSVLVVVVGPDSPGHSGTISVSGGNVTTWVNPLPAQGQNKPAIFVGTVTTAGSAPITVTGNSGQVLVGTVTCWTGVATSGTVDQGGTQYTASGATQAPGLVITPSVSNELLIAAVSASASIGTTYGTPLFTEFSSEPYKTGNGTCNFSAGYYIQSTAATTSTYGWNVSGGSAGTIVGVVSLSPTVGGTSITIPLPT